jgi:hypothetical protein
VVGCELGLEEEGGIRVSVTRTCVRPVNRTPSVDKERVYGEKE